MDGRTFHQGFKKDPKRPKRKIDEIIAEMGVSKTVIYEQFKAIEVKEEYIELAKAHGLVFNEVSVTSEVEFLKTKIKLLESHIEDLRLTNETYRTLLKSLAEQDKTTVDKESSVSKKQKT